MNGIFIDKFIGASMTNHLATFREILERSDVVDGSELSQHARPLTVALGDSRMHMAQALVDKGADPNYTSAKFPRYIISVLIDPNEEVVVFLLRNGAYIPQGLSETTQRLVDAYVDRPWSPANHLSWPHALRAQIQTMLALARGPRATALSRVHADILVLLFAHIAANHFVFVA